MDRGSELASPTASRTPPGLSVDSAFRIEPNRPDGCRLRDRSCPSGCSQQNWFVVGCAAYRIALKLRRAEEKGVIQYPTRADSFKRVLGRGVTTGPHQQPPEHVSKALLTSWPATRVRGTHGS